MFINQKLGNLASYTVNARSVDYLPLEWWERNKRILHKKTTGGKAVVLKFLGEAQQLSQDDVLYADEESIVAVDLLPCEAMVITPQGVYETAFACYEIGNKHLPLFYEDGALLMPYDAPTFRLLQASGLTLEKQHRKLLHPLRTTVLPHAHNGGESLFSKIMKLTAGAAD